jgi:predicted amidophosphoribosyltransferase
VKKFQQQWKQVKSELELQTKLCKCCFGKVDHRHLFDIFNYKSQLCHHCSQQFKYRHLFTKIHGKYLYVPYRYEAFFKGLIHQFKSAKDNELGVVFLDPLNPWIRLWFQVDGLLLAPSARVHIEERGFHHLIELFETLNIPMYDCFLKTHAFKQADQTFVERNKINQYIVWNPLFDRLDISKNYIVVDDVYTTGNTLNTLVKILLKKGFRKIRLFAFAATEKKQED